LQRIVLAIDAIRLRIVHFDVGRCHWTWPAVLAGVPVGIHHSKVMFSVLVQILGRDPIAARRGLARQGYVSFKYLIGVAANFDIWSIAVESLNAVRHARAVMMWIIPIVTAARSLVWTWSHDTCLIW
jgi:hypothetical protein